MRSITGLIVLLLSTTLHAETLFLEDFDSLNGWVADDVDCVHESDADGCDNVPGAFTFYRAFGAFPGVPTMQVVQGALAISDESWGNGSQHGSDGIVLVELDQEYPALFMRFDVAFDAWAWGAGLEEQQNTLIGKIARFERFAGAPDDSRFNAFSNGVLHPIAIAGTGVYRNGAGNLLTRINHARRCTPANGVSAEYNCQRPSGGNAGPSNNMTSAVDLLDGGWHTVEMEVRMNSAPGVADGVMRTWADGVLLMEDTDVAWAWDGAMVGWNTASFGGNFPNRWVPGSPSSSIKPGPTDCPTGDCEQQWFIDNAQVCTERCVAGEGPIAEVASEPFEIRITVPAGTSISIVEG